MDRLRKRLEQFRVKVRAFIKYNWHNEPEGDKFRSLDILCVLGGVRYKPTSKWRRICWNAYCVQSVCSFLIFILNAMDEISGKFNLTKATWHAIVVLTTSLCLIKGSILNRHFESIQTARKFINSKPFASGDSLLHTVHDSARRKKCFQLLQSTSFVFLAMVLIDHVIVNSSIAALDELLGTPRILQYLGLTAAEILHFLFLLTLCPQWINKICAGTGTVCSLLYGFNTEYEIFVRSFDNILDNVYSDVEEELPSTSKAAPDSNRFQRDHLYWKYLKKRVNDQIELHVQFAENLQLLEPVVKNLFGIMYYNLMVQASSVSYVLVTNGLSAASFFMASGIATLLLECYVWCRIIDTLKDYNKTLELKIMDLIIKMPYSEFHRRKYAEMRTTLCIMKTFIRNHEPFSCAGVFPISVETFTELLHICYTVFTFLKDMEKMT